MGRKMDEDVLENLCKVYGYTKHLMIIAEEVDPEESKTYLQPRLELFQAFDHLMSDYYLPKLYENQEGSLDAVNKHICTAFFDVADWTNLKIRNCIREELKKYSADDIKSAIPNYYSDIRPNIDLLTDEIIKIRENKMYEDLQDTNKYIECIEKLREYLKTVTRARGSLIELRRKNLLVKWVGPAIGLLGILAAIIVAIFD